MVNKYARHLEEWDVNAKTGEVWVLDDVPNTWKARTKAKVEADGYTWDEDGHAIPRVEEEPKKGKK